MTRINSLIRPQPWISWILVAAGILTWGGLLWSGVAIDLSRPELREVLGLAAGHVARYFSVTMLLAASAFSAIILWYRTHSRKDFHGRYRVWIWSSLVWPVFLSAAATDWHLEASRRVAAIHPALAILFGSRFWMIPATILFWTTVRVMVVDMSSYNPSRWLTRVTAVVAAACLLLQFRIGFLNPSVLQIASRSLETLWPLLLTSALLHHARFVIHVTNEVGPLKRRHGRLSPLMKEVWEEICLLVPSQEQVLQALRPANRAKSTGRRLWSLLGRGRRSLPGGWSILTTIAHRIVLLPKVAFGRFSRTKSREDGPKRRTRKASDQEVSKVPAVPAASLAQSHPEPERTETRDREPVASTVAEGRRSEGNRRDRRLQRVGR